MCMLQRIHADLFISWEFENQAQLLLAIFARLPRASIATIQFGFVSSLLQLRLR